jgi:hypothetical protein
VHRETWTPLSVGIMRAQYVYRHKEFILVVKRSLRCKEQYILPSTFRRRQKNSAIFLGSIQCVGRPVGPLLSEGAVGMVSTECSLRYKSRSGADRRYGSEHGLVGGDER